MLITVKKGNKILNSLKSTEEHLRPLSDQKIFTVDRSHNWRNTRWIYKSPTCPGATNWHLSWSWGSSLPTVL